MTAKPRESRKSKAVCVCVRVTVRERESQTLAKANTLLSSRSLSPMNFDSKLLGDRSKKLAPLSPATAFASSVFPVPGGP